MRYCLFIICCLFSVWHVYSQVKGTVVDENQQAVVGANVFWLDTTEGTATDGDGQFLIKRLPGVTQLVVSFIGYETQTIQVEQSADTPLLIRLKESLMLDEVSVVSRKVGLTKLRNTVFNTDMINESELFRAACCNLGESFTTNPSVDVTYADAATGAKQIRLLGLSGTYVQMLTENIPNFRGAASPYGLGYVPGPWMQAIQVSKGTSSVKNGYEAITGQINIEYKKPQTADIVSANLFAATSGRYEANADASIHLNPNLSTMLMVHYENETEGHDRNKDGFLDYPSVEQYNLFNRWAYTKGRYLLLAGVKALKEERTGGQKHHSSALPQGGERYSIGIDTERVEAFIKNAYAVSTDRNGSVALMLSGSIHNQEARFGHKLYDVDQRNGYASLLYETDLGKGHSLSSGLSFNYDEYDQHYNLTGANTYKQDELQRESVTGAYAQYTYSMNDKLVLMAGLRGDYSSNYDFFVTPRFHLKYTPGEYLNIRLSAGKGYRTNYVLAENNYLLASSRKIVIDNDLKQEEAWNFGLSASAVIPLFGKSLSLNGEFYYTNFEQQMVVDMDSDAHRVCFGNLNGKSYARNFQLDASYPFFQGFTLLAAYRLSDVKTTYAGVLREKPLTSKYKGLLTASYQTPLGIWQFDVTLQLNGGGRMPLPYQLPDGSESWQARYGAFEQLSAQITRYFRRWSVYVGGENLTDFTQKRTIVDASNPWVSTFDSTMVWGPVHGVKGYVGVRFNLSR